MRTSSLTEIVWAGRVAENVSRDGASAFGTKGGAVTKEVETES